MKDLTLYLILCQPCKIYCFPTSSPNSLRFGTAVMLRLRHRHRHHHLHHDVSSRQRRHSSRSNFWSLDSPMSECDFLYSRWWWGCKWRESSDSVFESSSVSVPMTSIVINVVMQGISSVSSFDIAGSIGTALRLSLLITNSNAHTDLSICVPQSGYYALAAFWRMSSICDWIWIIK